MNLINHFIGGKLTPGTSELKSKVYDPSIGEQKSEVFLGNKSDIDEAIKVAKKAFGNWSLKPPLQRLSLIHI